MQKIDSSNRLDWLDALRGWAVLGVVCVHSAGVTQSTGLTGKIASSGQYGVQLFFVISAITISLTYQAHIARYGRSLRSQLSWLTKRFFRIAPLYYLAAVFYPIWNYAVFRVTHHQYGGTTQLGHILANLAFIHEWVPSANNSVVPGGWSIGVEMFFYATVPFIWLIRSVPRRVTALVFAAAMGPLVTLLVSLATTNSLYVTNNTFLYFWFPTEAPAIIIGLLLYLAKDGKFQPSTSPLRTLASLTCSVILFSIGIYVGTGTKAAPMLAPAIMAGSFAFLMAGLNGPIKAAIVNPPAIALGGISFSVYIVHFAVLTIAHAVFHKAHLSRSGPLPLASVIIATLAVTSIIATFTKRFIEDPFNRIGHTFASTMALKRPVEHQVLPTRSEPTF
jgi:peptidoglycan/LPS O-acetylase OafA/YrhL